MKHRMDLEDMDIKAFSTLTEEGKKEFAELCKRDLKRKATIRDEILKEFKEKYELPPALLKFLSEKEETIDLVIALDKSLKEKGKDRVVFITNCSEILKERKHLATIFENMLILDPAEGLEQMEKEFNKKNQPEPASYIG